MANCPFNPASESVADFILRYGSQPEFAEGQGDVSCMDFVTLDYSILYTPLDLAGPISFNRYPYYSIPVLYSLLDTSSMEASGILSTFASPTLGNQGQGVLVGVIDTGIDYTNPLFRYADGSTRITSIWDQSIPAEADGLPPGVPGTSISGGGASYGTQFTREEINQALASSQPFSLVPSTDTNGHGTFLAGIAAGGTQADFTGAAPRSELAIVKLKPAKRYLRNFYLVDDSADVFQENDIMMGIKYMREESYRLGKPMVILLGLGSNMGSHGGASPLSIILQDVGRSVGMVSVLAAGNEASLQHHYRGTIPSGDEWTEAEIRVGQPESRRGFVVELWAAAADTYSVGFVSPSGEVVGRIPNVLRNETSIAFVLEPTVITLTYHPLEAGAGKQLIFMRFQAPSPGIWRIRIYNTYSLTGQFDMWLPSQGMISNETYFLAPDPYVTVTLPGNTSSAITVGAYDHLNNSIYAQSGRGYTASGLVKPDLVAPGVNIIGPGIRPPRFTTRSGTSIAAAHVAGAAAILLSWGIVSGNNVTMSEAAVKSYLIQGAKRNPVYSYPNREWGYGMLDLYGAFLRTVQK